MTTPRTRTSPSWYRLNALRPRLRPHGRIHRQVVRGERWYVLQDRVSGRLHRFSAAAHLVIGLMDGRRTVQEVWEISCARLGDDALTQEQMIRLLAQLHQADMLQGDVPPDIAELATRAARQRRQKLMQTLANPLSLRIPLVDPDRFLAATAPLLRPLAGWLGGALYLLLLLFAGTLALVHWSALTDNVLDRVLAADSLLLLLVTYPVVKGLHELGHAYATKLQGGEVHEMGVMFLVFMPVPYVDASAAAAFRSKWRRALVGAAGILVELGLAAIALLVWVESEPGLVRAIAFNVALIGSVSTVAFNGNPLLRFDGYYVLADLLEIPNLGQRANRYVGYLVQRHVFGVADATSPVTARGEARWMLPYALASFAYRISVAAAIVLFVASRFFVVGVVLAIWAAILMFAWPTLRFAHFLFASPVLRGHRLRAVSVTGATVAALVAAVGLVPLPAATVGEAVVWSDTDTRVRGLADGVVAELLTAPNAQVRAGTPLLRLEDPMLPARVRVLEAELRQLELRHVAALVQDPSETRILAEQIRHAEAELALNRQRAADLVVRSPADGRFIVPDARDLPGRFVRSGDTVGYVTTLADPVLRAVVPQSAIDRVRQGTGRVEVRFADRFAPSLPATIVREIPTVSDKLPSAALGSRGGGQAVADPRDASGAAALERLYQIDLRIDAPSEARGIGGRVHVRFDHGTEPLASLLYRELRQLFLKRFNV